MPRFRALVAYEGAAFHGWQIQPDVRTIEGDLTRALATISGRGTADPATWTKVQGASRTDAGVHAWGQVAHFDYHGELDSFRLRKALNGVSEPEVRVVHLEPVASEFNARHHARGKCYRYDLWVDHTHHPHYRQTSHWVSQPLDAEQMRRGAAHLMGRHDFSALRASSCQAKSPVLDLFQVTIERHGPLIQIYVFGAAFLKYMVRTLAGTLIEIGRGRYRPDDMRTILASKDRHRAGATAPGRGLHLLNVFYPGYPWQSGEITLTSGAEGIKRGELPDGYSAPGRPVPAESGDSRD